MSNDSKRVLFLCTGNACRSQMAEGWCRALLADRYVVVSAGIEKHGLDPLAVKVMAEAGVDISSHCSKTITELGAEPFDYVITVCGDADANCPYVPAKTKVIHHGFDDPPKHARHEKSDAAVLAHYRRVRDEIRLFIGKLPELLGQQSPSTADPV